MDSVAVEGLRRARARIERPESWCRTYCALDAHGEPTDPDAKDAVCWCARGALEAEGYYVLAEGEDTDQIDGDEPWWFLHLAARRLRYGSIEAFNDGQSHAEVLALYDRAISLAEAAA